MNLLNSVCAEATPAWHGLAAAWLLSGLAACAALPPAKDVGRAATIREIQQETVSGNAPATASTSATIERTDASISDRNDAHSAVDTDAISPD